MLRNFQIGPLPDIPSNPPNAPKLPNRAPGAAAKPAKPALGTAKPMSYDRSSLSFATGPDIAGFFLQTLQMLRNFQIGPLPDIPFEPSKRSETSKPGPWSCRETCQTGSWNCQTMSYDRSNLSFATGPILAGFFLQTLQMLRNFQIGPLPDIPFEPSKRSETSKPGPWSCRETCQTGSWNCQTMSYDRSNLFLCYRPDTAGFFLQTLQTLRNFQIRPLELPRNLPNQLLELPNYEL